MEGGNTTVLRAPRVDDPPSEPASPRIPRNNKPEDDFRSAFDSPRSNNNNNNNEPSLGGDEQRDVDPDVRRRDVEAPRPGQPARTREDEQESFYCLRTEQHVTRDVKPADDLAGRLEWEARHFGEARWHAHARSRVQNPLTGAYNVRPKVTTAVFERMLQTKFDTTYRTLPLYVLMMRITSANLPNMYEFARQTIDRLTSLARLVSLMGFTDKLSLTAAQHSAAKQRLLNTRPSLKSTLEYDHASPQDPYVAVLALPYPGVKGLLVTLQSRFSVRAMVSKFNVAPEDVAFLGHFWRDDTSDAEARTGTLLPEQASDCFGRDVPQRLSGPTTRTVNYYESPEGYEENGLATGRPSEVFRFPAADPRYTSWARRARPRPRRSVTRHVLAQDPGSMGTGIPRDRLVAGRPDIGPGRDPVNDHGIYQNYFVCCGQSLDNEGCLIDVFDARTNKSRAYKLFTRKDARQLYAWIREKVEEGRDREQIVSGGGLMILASVRRGTAWIDRTIYDAWHAEILELWRERLSGFIVLACGALQQQDWQQHDFLEYVPYFLDVMPDVVRLYTLVATYNGYRCHGGSMRALPQSPVEWLHFLVSGVLHLDAIVEPAEMIQVHARIDIIGQADLSLSRASMFSDSVMHRIARMTREGERILTQQQELREERQAKERAEMEREEERKKKVAVPPPAPSPGPRPAPQPEPSPPPVQPQNVEPIPAPEPKKATPTKVVVPPPTKPVQPEPLPVLPPLEPEPVPGPAPTQPSPAKVVPRTVKKTSPSPAAVVVVTQPPPTTKVVVEVTPQQQPTVVVVQPEKGKEEEESSSSSSSEFELRKWTPKESTEDRSERTTTPVVKERPAAARQPQQQQGEEEEQRRKTVELNPDEGIDQAVLNAHRKLADKADRLRAAALEADADARQLELEANLKRKEAAAAEALALKADDVALQAITDKQRKFREQEAASLRAEALKADEEAKQLILQADTVRAAAAQLRADALKADQAAEQILLEARKKKRAASDDDGEDLSVHPEQQEKVWSPSEVGPAPEPRKPSQAEEEEESPVPVKLEPPENDESTAELADAQKRREEQLEREQEAEDRLAAETARIKQEKEQEEDAKRKAAAAAKAQQEAIDKEKRLAKDRLTEKQQQEARAKQEQADKEEVEKQREIEDRDRRAAEREAARLKAEAEQKAKEEADKRAKEEAEAARLRDQAKKKQWEAAEASRRAEAEEQARLKAEREQEAERQRQAEEQQKIKDAEERRLREEAERKAEQARLAAQKAKEDDERRLQEEAERKAEQEREQAKQEEERLRQRQAAELQARKEEEERERQKQADALKRQQELEAGEAKKEAEEPKTPAKGVQPSAVSTPPRKQTVAVETPERRQDTRKKNPNIVVDVNPLAGVKQRNVFAEIAPAEAIAPVLTNKKLIGQVKMLRTGPMQRILPYGDLVDAQFAALLYFRDMLRTMYEKDAVCLIRGGGVGHTYRIWENGKFNCAMFNEHCLSTLNHIFANDENILFGVKKRLKSGIGLFFYRAIADMLTSYIAVNNGANHYRVDTLTGAATKRGAIEFVVSAWSTTLRGDGILTLKTASDSWDDLSKCVEIAGKSLSNFISLVLHALAGADFRKRDKPANWKAIMGLDTFAPYYVEFEAIAVAHSMVVRKDQSETDFPGIITLQAILDYVSGGKEPESPFHMIGEELSDPAPAWNELDVLDQQRLQQVLQQAPPRDNICEPITTGEKKIALNMAAFADTLQNIELKQKYVIHGAKEQGKEVSPVIDWNEVAVNKFLLLPITKAYATVLLRLGGDGYIKKFTQEGEHLVEMGRSALAQTRSTDPVTVAIIGQELLEQMVPLDVLKDIGLLVPEYICTRDEEAKDGARLCHMSLAVSSGCSKCSLPGYKDVAKYDISEVMELFHRWGILAEIFSLILAGTEIDQRLGDAIAVPWNRLAAASYRVPPASIKDDIGAWAEEYGVDADEDDGITEEVSSSSSSTAYSVPPSSGFWSSLKSVFSDDAANDPASIASWGMNEDDVY